MKITEIPEMPEKDVLQSMLDDYPFEPNCIIMNPKDFRKFRMMNEPIYAQRRKKRYSISTPIVRV